MWVPEVKNPEDLQMFSNSGSLFPKEETEHVSEDKGHQSNSPIFNFCHCFFFLEQEIYFSNMYMSFQFSS